MKPELNRASSAVRPLLLGVAGLLFASLFSAPLTAQVYKIQMKSGNEFVSKYKPRQAWYSEDKLLIMTKAGNIVALDKSDIETVESDLESRGFGVVIDTTTVMVGTRPNDMPVLDDDAINQALDRASRLQSLRGRQPQNFSSPLFSEPNGGGGLPVGFLNTVTPPIGNPPR
ncbi:MAG: hypothetical protein AAGK22_23085 [Acidobacteriota bacterium]